MSWIIGENGYDEHAPSPAAWGELFTSVALRALTANPDVWSKTVMFVMYDENDGFFDHVAPPVPDPGTPGEYVTVRPLPADAGGIDGPIGLGFGVPMLVLSPFARGGRVATQVFDHTSQLRFVESRWGVEVPNLSAWRRQVTGDLTSALDLGQPDTTVPIPPRHLDRDPWPFRSATPARSSRSPAETTPASDSPVDAQPGGAVIPRRETLSRSAPERTRCRFGGQYSTASTSS